MSTQKKVHQQSIYFDKVAQRQQQNVIPPGMKTLYADAHYCPKVIAPTKFAFTKLGKWYTCAIPKQLSDLEVSEIEKTLTVIPNEDQLKIMAKRGNHKARFRVKPHRLYDIVNQNLYVPRFYGLAHFGYPQHVVQSWKFDERIEGPSTHIGKLELSVPPLYPSQTEAIAAWTANLHIPLYGGGGVIAAATGAGKSYMLAMAIQQRGCKTIVLEPSALMVEQITEDLVDYLPGLRVISPHKDPRKRTWDADVLVMTMQMASRIPPSANSSSTSSSTVQEQGETVDDEIAENINASIPSPEDLWAMGYRMLVIDEAHHVAAPSLRAATHRLSMKYVIGLSATPNRTDGLERVVYMFLGPIVYHWFPPEPLIRSEIWRVDTGIEIPLTYRKKEPDMDAFYVGEATNEKRCEIVSEICKVVLDKGIGTMVTARRVEQLRLTLHALKEYYITQGFHWKGDPDSTKECLFSIHNSPPTDEAGSPNPDEKRKKRISRKRKQSELVEAEQKEIVKEVDEQVANGRVQRRAEREMQRYEACHKGATFKILLLTKDTPKEITKNIRQRTDINLILTTLFKGEGLSYSFVRMLVISSTLKGNTSQIIGRSIRPGKGKNKAAIIDLCDSSPMCIRHGEQRLKVFHGANHHVRHFTYHNVHSIQKLPWDFFSPDKENNRQSVLDFITARQSTENQ